MKKIILAVLLMFSLNAKAVAWVEIDDASRLLWQMQPTGTVWFRNLNEFDPGHGGCCYAYWLDTTTPGGKALWTVILMKMAEHKRITLGFDNVGSNNANQPLLYIGRFEHQTNE